MSMYRVLALFGAALAFIFATSSFAPVSEAQGLTRYGMWGNNIKRRRSTSPKIYKLPPPKLFGDPQMLGAQPRAARAVIRKKRRKPVELAQGGARPDIKPKTPKTVTFNSDAYKPGDIVIDTKRRKLFLLLAQEGYALSYPIAVGKRGFTWTGVEQVSHIQDWPDWHPPEEMRERSPSLPKKMTGGIKNPLGAKAIYLGKTLYRIHGTNARWTIGRASSSGCFRMHNAHVVHLARLVDKTTTVHVLDRLPRGVVKDEVRKRKWKKRSARKRYRKYRRIRRPRSSNAI